jgi:hypothetical protein
MPGRPLVSDRGIRTQWEWSIRGFRAILSFIVRSPRIPVEEMFRSLQSSADESTELRMEVLGADVSFDGYVDRFIDRADTPSK